MYVYVSYHTSNNITHIYIYMYILFYSIATEDPIRKRKTIIGHPPTHTIIDPIALFIRTWISLNMVAPAVTTGAASNAESCGPQARKTLDARCVERLNTVRGKSH